MTVDVIMTALEAVGALEPLRHCWRCGSTCSFAIVMTTPEIESCPYAYADNGIDDRCTRIIKES